MMRLAPGARLGPERACSWISPNVPQGLNADQAALGRGHSFSLQTLIERLLCSRHSRHRTEQNDKVPDSST